MRINSRTLHIEPDGFSVVAVNGQRTHVSWSEVREVVAYKLDLLTTDEVRLSFALDHSRSPIEISEEMEGFDQFRFAAERALGFPEGWWRDVGQPAFAESRSVLFLLSQDASNP